MENIVVTIARQYGSGGKTIGEMYAEEMGIPCYGSNLLQMASEEFNLARAMERNSMTTEEMKKFIATTDRYRSEYYKHYTGREWSDARNYDLCLNSGKLGFEKCVEEIKAYIKVRFEQ